MFGLISKWWKEFCVSSENFYVIWKLVSLIHQNDAQNRASIIFPIEV